MMNMDERVDNKCYRLNTKVHKESAHFLRYRRRKRRITRNSKLSTIWTTLREFEERCERPKKDQKTPNIIGGMCQCDDIRNVNNSQFLQLSKYAAMDFSTGSNSGGCTRSLHRQAATPATNKLSTASEWA